MRLDKWLLTFVLIGIVVTVGTLWISDMNTNYSSIGVDMSTDNLSSFQKINESFAIVEAQKDKTLGGELDSTDSVSSMLAGSYGAIRLLVNSFDLVGDILTTISDKLGLPTFWFSAAMAAVGIFLVFALIFMIFRIATG